jgi:lipopolysaccharide biosynthesis glycosyltransferase
MNSPEPIVICCAADEGYVIPLVAMIKSLLINLRPQRPITLYIFDEGISESSKARLIESWGTDGLTVHWLQLEQANVANLPLWGEMKAIAYYKLMLPAYLPGTLDKVLWLDCDMIVTGNIADLWGLELGDHALLAAQDLAIPFIGSPFGVAAYKELGLPPQAKYFNSAVMVINVNWWRQHDLTGKVLAYLKNHNRSVFLWDQDGLNAVLVGQWGELDPRWNQIASICGRSFFKAEHLSRETYQQLIKDPWIVHYAGNFKPWSYENKNPTRALYFGYVDKTVWAGWRPAQTIKRRFLGIYDSWLRPLLYPFEQIGIRLWRLWTRRLS